jgi:hypothetical protein
VKLSREESEALIERIQASSLAGDDQRLLVKLIQLYFWLTVALRETKISLPRLKRALCGEGKPPPSRPPTAGGPWASGGGRLCRPSRLEPSYARYGVGPLLDWVTG